MSQKIRISDIKEALLDQRFREKLPPELQDDVNKFLSNPSCSSCNNSIFIKVAQLANKTLAEYFPSKQLDTNEIKPVIQNNWRVINCSIDELEKQLKSLPAGRKQLQMARYQDQVTVIINEVS